MAKDDMPFDEDTMTLIMGLGGPDEPGQHGPTKAPMPEAQALDVLIQIRDLADEFIQKAGKGDEEKPEDSEKPEDTEEE